MRFKFKAQIGAFRSDMEEKIARCRRCRVDRSLNRRKRSQFQRLLVEVKRSQRLQPIPTIHDSRAERSRNPTVLTRSSSPSSAKQTFVRAVSSFATVTTRKTAARDRGASILCASIGTLFQSFSGISDAPRFSELQMPCL